MITTVSYVEGEFEQIISCEPGPEQEQINYQSCVGRTLRLVERGTKTGLKEIDTGDLQTKRQSIYGPESII